LEHRRAYQSGGDGELEDLVLLFAEMGKQARS
jgi:hypothetical protein